MPPRYDQTTPSYFDYSTSSWVPVSKDLNSQPSRFDHGSGSPFRIATLNVLADIFPKPVELVTQSAVRRQELVRLLAEQDATIVGLNEVTPTILGEILKSPFVREKYYISETLTSPVGAISKHDVLAGSHGCVLLSKIPFVELWFADTLEEDSEVPRKKKARRAVVGLFRVSDIVDPARPNQGYFAVASEHTQAYQNENNLELRKHQIKSACTFMTNLLGRRGDEEPEVPRINSRRFVLMGDLNLHYVCEDAVVLDNGLVDAWAETNFDTETENFPDGFTYDSQTNGMVPVYVPGENRRMRLDRILCTPEFFSCFSPHSPCSLWANKPIDADRSVWPSDHYGLTIDVVAAKASFVPNPAVQSKLEENARMPREKSTYTMWTFARAMPYQIWFLGRRLTNL